MISRQIINQYILTKLKEGVLDPGIAVEIVKELNKVQAYTEDIAVIGMSCLYPEATTPEEFWSCIAAGKEMICNYPKERANDTGIFAKYTAAFLKNIGDFDARFFNISPREAKTMHPAQRLFLEQSWKAMEDAGYCSPSMEKSSVGVFLGIDHSHQLEYVNNEKGQEMFYMVGDMTSILASRISYVLNLCGPSMVIDTACSSGLVSIHEACQSIRNGDCEMAIAGGLNLIGGIVPTKMDGFESKTGRIGSFDKHTTGAVWGEGIALVVLKKLSEAQRDNDHIYAVIKGSAINNDGKTSGITAPGAETFANVVVKAWERANINPEDISYIVANAMGTALGDPIEIKALKSAFERYTKRKQFCAIGSVKPNLGHSVGMSGVSSLLTAIMAMKHRKIPPNINFLEPNPFIGFQNSPVYLNDILRDWIPTNGRMIVGINSIGFSRTNVHIVLEEAPQKETTPSVTDLGEVFVLSAKSIDTLREYATIYADYLKDCDDSLVNICYTAAIGRYHMKHRLALYVHSKDELRELLITFAQNKPVVGKALDEDICKRFTSGENINWKKHYGTRNCRRISLPTYPFVHTHFWLSYDEQPVGLMKNE